MQTVRCVIPSAGEVVLEPVSLPDLQVGRVRVATRYSLVSPGTELAMFNGSHIALPDPANTFAKYPFRPGYAAVGEVITSLVPEFGVGERVYYYGKHQGIQDIDPATQVLLRAPDGLASELVPFVRLAQIANSALIASNDAPMDLVAVIGLGLVGNFAAQLFRRKGAKVFAFDTIGARCDWAVACGVERATIVTSDLVETVISTVGSKVPLAVEATGNGAIAVNCLQMLSDRGTAVLLGSPRETANIDVYNLIHRATNRLVGAHDRIIPVLATSGLDHRTVSQELLDAMAHDDLVVRPLLSQSIRPADLVESYRALNSAKDRVLGVILDWQLA